MQRLYAVTQERQHQSVVAVSGQNMVAISSCDDLYPTQIVQF
jgi:hypothetical protein